MEQEWRDVIGYEGYYQVSNVGQVRRSKQSSGAKAGHILSQTVNRQTGYLMVGMSKNGRMRGHYVHVLVAEAFIYPRPIGMQVNHKDGNKTNNVINNLEYLTPSENTLHAYANGLIRHAVGEEIPTTRLNPGKVHTIRKLLKTHSQAEIARMYGVHQSSISDIATKVTWKHLQDQEN